MKAVRLTGIRQMNVQDVADPVIQADDDVLIRLGAVGVCGSDVHYYTTGRIGSQVVRYPFTVGHECAGTVEAVGRGVTHVRPGDRVAIEPAMSCGVCDQCRADRSHTCRALRFLGCPGQAEGCLSEFIVMPQECCVPIPDAMTLEMGALVEPLAISLYAVQLAALPPSARVGILGLGPIGLGVLLLARQQRAERIYTTDPVSERRAQAMQRGATWSGHPDADQPVSTILAAEPLQLDVVFECCGEQSAVDQAVDLLKPGGRLVLVGIPETDRISVCIDVCRRKELILQNVRRQNHCTRLVMDLVADGRIDVDGLITHRFPLERTREAFDLVDARTDGVVKAMIVFGS